MKRLDPPFLPDRPGRTAMHGRTRTDPYAWATRTDDPELRAFLRASNRHARLVMKPAEGLVRGLRDELQALTPPFEGPAPFRWGRHVYHLRHPNDRDYPQIVRWPVGAPQRIRTVLEVDALAGGRPFFAMPFFAISPDERFLAFAVDTTGGRRYAIRVRELSSGRDLPDAMRNADCNFAWRRDGRAIVYTRLDRMNQRPFAVRIHELGRPPRADRTLYVEEDDTFRCLLSPTRSRQYIRIVCFSANTEDTKLLKSADPDAPPVSMAPRVPGLVYDVDHGGGPFVVRTNRRRRDYAVFAADRPGVPPSRWRDLGRPYNGAFVERMAAFRRHAILTERRRSALQIRLVTLATGESRDLEFPDPVYEAWVEPVPGMTDRTARIGYTSLITPVSYFDCALDTGRLRRVQREQVPRYRPCRYETWRGWAPARDGARIPFTAVRKRGTARRDGQPALVFAYGAYGTNIPPWFDQSRLPLLDRGFVYVIAHVRGGSELGQAWYEGGKKSRKATSARDLLDCAEHLVSSGLTTSGTLFAETLSAGGITVGEAINERPALFRGVVAHAPFVDPLTSMSDPDIPLTLSEYEEWGNPARQEDWLAMRAYSPYDNVRPGRYPSMLVTTNLNDSQVPFWESVKWVARLRRANRGPHPILLLTRRHADHDGPSGRSRRLRELAFEWAFLLRAAGPPPAPPEAEA